LVAAITARSGSTINVPAFRSQRSTARRPVHPEMYIRVSSRVPWLVIDDGLSQHAEGSLEPYREG
jgi:hypothetical protein